MNKWVREFRGAVTICDPDGIILEMNDYAAEMFASDGGYDLLGSNVLDCHPEPSRTKLKSMMDRKQTNTYTIEKNGQKKIIHQAPWYINGKYSGFLEISIELPDKMPHFNRD